MRIGPYHNAWSDEYAMQQEFSKWLERKNIPYDDEVWVAEVSRRADFLLIRDEGRLVNVEAKCNDLSTMIRQLNDHAIYCDYSFAFIPDCTMTPKWFKKRLQERGYGLIMYNRANASITEALEAHHNKPRNLKLREKAINKIRTAQAKQSEIFVKQ